MSKSSFYEFFFVKFNVFDSILEHFLFFLGSFVWYSIY